MLSNHVVLLQLLNVRLDVVLLATLLPLRPLVWPLRQNVGP